MIKQRTLSRNRIRNLAVFLSLLCILTLPAAAQVDSAMLSGTITDPSGAVVPGATLTLVSQETGLKREAVTSNAGTYTFSLVPVGNYTLTVNLSGFKTVSMKDLRLGVGDSRAVDIALHVAAADTTVTVESVLAPLEKTSATVGTVIGGEHIKDIPINGRHWANLMALAPGAINTGEGNQQSIRFVGRARDDNNWTFDGVDATGVKDPRQEAALRLVISSDSIAEFRVNSTLYTAESGGGAGGQVNIVSKSGSNAFHGSVFEFLRNDVFDARNPFDSSKQPFRLNQFGGNFGGPIIRNRTFFFGNYEGLRQSISQEFRNEVPSAAFRARATDSNVKTILNAYPAGTERTSSADVDYAVGAVNQRWREDSFTVRVDHSFNASNNFYARYNMDDGTIIAPRTIVAGDRQDSFFRPSNFAMQYQRIFTPSVVNEAKIGMNRSSLNRYSLAPFRESIAVSGFVTLNNSSLLVENGTSFSLVDNLVITRSRHTLKFGGEIRRAHVNVADPAIDGLAITFANRNDLLANKVDRVAITGAPPVLGTRKWYYFGYVQDDFKVSPELTLNLGLRYEYYGVNREVKDRYRVFDLERCKGFCPHGSPWYFPDRNNLDPRIGIAWSPKALKGKTVIRIGGGIYHGPGQIDDKNASLDNMAQNFSLTAADAPGLSYPITPFIAKAKDTGITPRSLQRDIRDLYSAQWGLSIQQELPSKFVTQIAYSGSAGSHITSRTYINNIDPVTKVRPLPTFGRMDEKNGWGHSNFNALQLSLHRRVGRGLNLGSEYMWSHSINDAATGGGEGAQPQIQTCRACDRGNSNTDVRHTITANWMYELPFGPGQPMLNSGPLSVIFGGWEMNGIFTARTGRMLTITVSRSSSAVPDGNTSNQRPNLVSGTSLYPSGGPTLALWLNPAAFAIPANGTWGNAGRAIAIGPGLKQVDFSLRKRTRLAEGKAIVFSADMFNIANWVLAGNPGTTFTSTASFGRITSGLNRTIGTGTSRQIQFGLRFTF
jgi:hypothetical protein